MKKIICMFTMIIIIGVVNCEYRVIKSHSKFPEKNAASTFDEKTSNFTLNWTAKNGRYDAGNHTLVLYNGEESYLDGTIGVITQPADKKWQIRINGGSCRDSVQCGEWTSNSHSKGSWGLDGMYLKPPNEGNMTFNLRGSSDNGKTWSAWRTTTIAARSWGNNASGVNWGNVPDNIQNETDISWNFSTGIKSYATQHASYNAGSSVDCGIPGIVGKISENGNSFNCSGKISVQPKFYMISFYNAGVSDNGGYTISKQIEVTPEPITPDTPDPSASGNIDNNYYPSVGSISIKNGKLIYSNLHGIIFSKKIVYKNKSIKSNPVSPKYVGKSVYVTVNVFKNNRYKIFTQKVKVSKFLPKISIKKGRIIIKKSGIYAKSGYIKVKGKKIKVRKGKAIIDVFKFNSGKYAVVFKGNSQFIKARKIFRIS